MTLGQHATVDEAIQIMDKHNIAVVVVAKEKEPVGIVTERDIIRRV